MTVQDTLLGSMAAFVISGSAFLYLALSQAVGLAHSPAPEIPIAPVMVGAYAGIVGTGLLIGGALLRARRAAG